MFYLISVLLIIADQIFKLVAKASLYNNNTVVVIPGFFELTYVENTGAAWGIFKDGTIYLTIISFVASIAIAFMLFFAKTSFMKVSLALILAGAIGNLIDRIRLGYVIDYLSFYIFGKPFPVFNLADACIVMMIFLLFIHKEEDKIFDFSLLNFKQVKEDV